MAIPKSVTVVAHKGKPNIDSAVNAILTFLKEQQIPATLYMINSEKVSEIEPGELVIVLGGDGTILKSIKMLSKRDTPILPINMGSVGFISEVNVDEWRESLQNYFSGLLTTSHRLMLDITITRDGESVGKGTVLNDAVICVCGRAKLIRFSLSLHNGCMIKYRADGVIIATATGSTAYSMSAGGPILYPEMEAILVTPICPFSLSNRPLIIPSKRAVTFEIAEAQRSDIEIVLDGQESFPLLPGDLISIQETEEKALIVNSGFRSFYEVVKTKLGWGEPIDA